MSKDKDKTNIMTIDNTSPTKVVGVSQEEVVKATKKLSQTLTAEPVKDSFLEEVKEMAIKAFEDKNPEKIDKLKKRLIDSAKNGSFICNAGDTNLLRYFCAKYKFKSSGTFLIL